ncbi:hypothetical protein ACOSQ2_006555 [Xanthoceras sorbifolium]
MGLIMGSLTCPPWKAVVVAVLTATVVVMVDDSWKVAGSLCSATKYNTTAKSSGFSHRRPLLFLTKHCSSSPFRIHRRRSPVLYTPCFHHYNTLVSLIPEIALQTTHHSHSDTAQSPTSRPASSDASLRLRRTSKALRRRAVFWNQSACRPDLKLLFLNQTARTSKALRKRAVFWF